MKNLVLITLIQIATQIAAAQSEQHHVIQVAAESFRCRPMEDVGFSKLAEIVELDLKSINQLDPDYQDITLISARVHIMNYACVQLKQLASQHAMIEFNLVATTVVLGPNSIHKTVQLESLVPAYSFLNLRNTNATTKFSRKIKIPLSKITCGIEYDYNYLTGRTEFEVLRLDLQDINAMTPTFEVVQSLQSSHPLQDQVCERLKAAATENTELEFNLGGQLRYILMYVEEPIRIHEIHTDSLDSKYDFLNLRN